MSKPAKEGRWSGTSSGPMLAKRQPCHATSVGARQDSEQPAAAAAAPAASKLDARRGRSTRQRGAAHNAIELPTQDEKFHSMPLGVLSFAPKRPKPDRLCIQITKPWGGEAATSIDSCSLASRSIHAVNVWWSLKRRLLSHEHGPVSGGPRLQFADVLSLVD